MSCPTTTEVTHEVTPFTEMAVKATAATLASVDALDTAAKLVTAAKKTWKNLTWKHYSQCPEEPRPVPSLPKEPVTINVPQRLRDIGKARPMALELCCGHAGLTAALWDAGIETVGIDWSGNKHEAVVPIAQADLTTK